MSSLVVPCQFCNSYIPKVPPQIDEFQIWVKEQREKAKVMMMKSPSKEEKVVDMKATAQQSRGATWQPSVEATQPPGDGTGAGAAGAGAGGPAAVDKFEIWVKEQWEKATMTMMKSPSDKEKVVDMKTAAQQLRGATWKPSVEATQPPGDGAGAGAIGAGAGGPAGTGEGMLFETFPKFYPPHLSGRILRYFY